MTVLKKDSGLRRGADFFYLIVSYDGSGSRYTSYDNRRTVNVAPSIDTRLQAAQNAIDLARLLGNKNPKVAVLSGTESPIKSMPSSIEASEISRRAK